MGRGCKVTLSELSRSWSMTRRQRRAEVRSCMHHKRSIRMMFVGGNPWSRNDLVGVFSRLRLAGVRRWGCLFLLRRLRCGSGPSAGELCANARMVFSEFFLHCRLRNREWPKTSHMRKPCTPPEHIQRIQSQVDCVWHQWVGRENQHGV